VGPITALMVTVLASSGSQVGVVSSAAAGFGLGVAIAGTPGPVQAILLGESVRGGMSRGFRAMAGANLTFLVLVVGLAFGVSIAAPSGTALRVLRLVGGLFILWLAIDAFRAANAVLSSAEGARRLPPALRGVVAVIVNPGAWIFLGTAASSLLSSAANSGGTSSAVLAAFALVAGIAIGDGAVVLLGGFGLRRAGDATQMWIRRALAGMLTGVGAWLVITGIVG
jgi:threonine/homoserine/homoserine lactone efflux protein